MFMFQTISICCFNFQSRASFSQHFNRLLLLLPFALFTYFLNDGKQIPIVVSAGSELAAFGRGVQRYRSSTEFDLLGDAVPGRKWSGGRGQRGAGGSPCSERGCADVHRDSRLPESGCRRQEAHNETIEHQQECDGRNATRQ